MISKLVLTSGIGDLLIDGLQMLTFFIDKAIYGLAKVVYAVFVNIANISLLSGEHGQAMADGIIRRVYILMAVVMAFVLAYNLLNYIVDPDKVKDKKVGASTFIKDVLLAIAIIALTPTIFSKLYSLQSIIISDGVIENLILGGAGDANSANETITNGANPMIASTYAAFLYPADGEHTALDCGENIEGKHGELYDSDPEYCEAYWLVQQDGELSHFEGLYMDEKYSYTPFLSTIGGGVLIYFMLVFSISLGKRVGKMALLELIAPIPLTLEILPNKKGLRDNWVKTSLKVFGEVFIYMGFMFLVIFLISLVPGAISTIFESGSGGFTGIVATLIVIIGLLIFGKEAPKMTCDLLGIKDTNFFKQAFADAKQGLAYGAVGAGLVGSTIGRFGRNYANSDGNFFSGAAGAASGFFRQVWGARNVHNLKDAANLNNNVNKTVTQRRIDRQVYKADHGGTTRGAIGGRFQDAYRSATSSLGNYSGHATGYQVKQRKQNFAKEYHSLFGSEVEKIYKNNSKWQTANEEYIRISTAYGANSDKAKQAKANLEEIRNTLLVNNKERLYEAAGKLNNYISANSGNGVIDQTIDTSQILSMNKDNVANVYDMLEQTDKTAKATNTEFANDKEYQERRTQEKLREDARNAAREAAQKQSQSDKDKK